MRSVTGPEDRAARRKRRRSSPRWSAMRWRADLETPLTSNSRAARAMSSQYSGGMLSRRFQACAVAAGTEMASASNATLGKQRMRSAWVTARLPPPQGGEPRRGFVIIPVCNLHTGVVKSQFGAKYAALGGRNA
jgi:hypothetical protein